MTTLQWEDDFLLGLLCREERLVGLKIVIAITPFLIVPPTFLTSLHTVDESLTARPVSVLACLLTAKNDG